jgi:hypothetical protein
VPRLSKKLNNPVIRFAFDNWQLSGTTSFASGRPKNLIGGSSAGVGAGSVTYTAGTATISSGQICPAGSIQTSATVCTMITDFTGGQNNARPFVTCDPMQGVTGSDSTGTPYVINVSCISAPTAMGQIGDLGRNSVRMSSTFNNDLAFFKNFKWGEKRNIRLRWEIYNIFNRSNFRDIDSTITFGIAQVNPGGTGAACTATNICTAIIRQTRDTAFGSPSSFGTPILARSPRVMQASIQIDF